MYYTPSRGLTNLSHFKDLYSMWQRRGQCMQTSTEGSPCRSGKEVLENAVFLLPWTTRVLGLLGKRKLIRGESALIGGWAQRNNMKEGTFCNSRVLQVAALCRQNWKPTCHRGDGDVGGPGHADHQYLRETSGGCGKGSVPAEGSYTNVLMS